MTQLTVGDVAPDFSLPDADGSTRSLRDYAGGRVIVYFYPAALTPGCTTQAIDFTANLRDFAQAGFAVVGISPDPVERLSEFRDKEQVRFPLLSDPDLTVLKAYGAYGAKMLYGKEVQSVLRSTFVVDVGDDGIGTVVLAQYNVRSAGHVEKLKRDLHLDA